MINYLKERMIRIEALEDRGSGSIDFFLDYLKNSSVNLDMESIYKTLSFVSGLNYFHEGLSKEQYLCHPLRVACLLLKYADEVSTDDLNLSLLHNILEVSDVKKVDLIERFGDTLGRAVTILTVDRDSQWDVEYKNRYYENIVNFGRVTAKVKILDKFDNIFIIGLNSKDEIRMKYLDEIRKYIIPMTSKFIPKLFDDFNLCCNEAETLGYFPK